MTFEPQTIETTDLLSTGTSKINDNFEAIAQEFESVADVVGDMLSGTQTYISVTYDNENNELDFIVDATATPTASKIPISDGSAKLDGWVSGTIGTPSATNPLVTNDDYEALSIEIVADALDINYIPDGYTPEATPGTAAIYQLVGHLKGISDKLAELESRIAALE